MALIPNVTHVFFPYVNTQGILLIPDSIFTHQWGFLTLKSFQLRLYQCTCTKESSPSKAISNLKYTYVYASFIKCTLHMYERQLLFLDALSVYVNAHDCSM